MKLSIIVPVYNVERYLECCVRSIIAQDIDDYEVLLIDDGSTDRSGELCDELQRRYGCVSVVHQTNGGLSVARNSGIDKARGEYITFVDSDDELYPNTLKDNLDFLVAHPEVDMLEYPVEVHAESAGSYMLTFSDETQTTDIFADWIRREGYKHCYAWNKIYRRGLWQSLRFPIRHYFEDGAVMPYLVKQCAAIHYSRSGCYRYIWHERSITTCHGYSKQRQLFLNNYRLFLEIKDEATLHSESLKLWICTLNQLIDMGRCRDVDNVDYHHMLDDVEQHLPSFGELLKITMETHCFKLMPLPVLGLRNYLRCYVGITSKL